MNTLVMLSVVLSVAAAKDAKVSSAQQSAQQRWTAAAEAGDVDQLKAICKAAGGELQLKKGGGGMAQPGMDMASMMMANMMMENAQQQAQCTNGRETLAWSATEWDGVQIEEPARR